MICVLVCLWKLFVVMVKLGKWDVLVLFFLLLIVMISLFWLRLFLKMMVVCGIISMFE